MSKWERFPNLGTSTAESGHESASVSCAGLFHCGQSLAGWGVIASSDSGLVLSMRTDFINIDTM